MGQTEITDHNFRAKNWKKKNLESDWMWKCVLVAPHPLALGR